MVTKKVVWYLGLGIAVLSAIVSYCSCTVTSDFSRAKSASPTVVAPVKVSQDGLSITKDSISVDSFNVH